MSGLFQGWRWIIFILIILILAGTFFAVYDLVLFEFEEKIDTKENQSEKDNYQKLAVRLADFEEIDYDRNIYSYKSVKKYNEIVEIVDKMEEERKNIINFIINNSVSQIELWEERNDRALYNVFYLELQKIILDLGNRRTKEGINRYNNLWEFVSGLLDTEEVILGTKMMTDVMIKDLIEVYFNYNQFFDGEEIDVHPVSFCLNNLNHYYVNCLSTEYYFNKTFLQEELEKSKKRDLSTRILFSWPLFHRDRTQEKIHDYFLKKINMVETEPFYYWSEKEFIDIEENILDHKIENIFNPIGRNFLTIALPRLTGMNEAHYQLKSRLVLFQYIIELDDRIPDDPLTGKPFLIKDEGDFRIILSEYQNEDGIHPVKYVISNKHVAEMGENNVY